MYVCMCVCVCVCIYEVLRHRDDLAVNLSKRVHIERETFFFGCNLAVNFFFGL